MLLRLLVATGKGSEFVCAYAGDSWGWASAGSGSALVPAKTVAARVMRSATGDCGSGGSERSHAMARSRMGVGAGPGACGEDVGAKRKGGLAQVTGIRHWSTPNYTRVAIDLGDDVTYEAARVPNPDRIYSICMGRGWRRSWWARALRLPMMGF